MKKMIRSKKAGGKINPYPFLLLVMLLLAVIFIVIHFIFRNTVF
ncbi:hypothetical protein [Mucilaginibacter aquariorum]|uniref:Uncharacterized protein n=1 Tax=Mucilaginibacter aquariorum TaxID=2967225 RepID=A0ABT1TA57_9SPHI|nr:hypothetical protein [Mucilaginibacter aquariorum]MCQ6961511.1 hypothetical protein [Mucilaginibacter aquariorum]